MWPDRYYLFDSIFIHCYVSIKFALGLDLVCDIFDSSIYVPYLIGDFMILTHVCHTCFVLFMGFPILVDLIILYMLYFDLILGMTWLFSYSVVLNYNSNSMTLDILGIDKLDGKVCISWDLWDKRLFGRWCSTFIAHLQVVSRIYLYSIISYGVKILVSTSYKLSCYVSRQGNWLFCWFKAGHYPYFYPFLLNSSYIVEGNQDSIVGVTW